jgi:16S rRNA processing protein RimM
LTLVTVGRVGRPHGRDGSFWVENARHDLPEGTEVHLAGGRHTIERRGGSADRPLVRLSDVADATTVRGELLLADEVLDDNEWLASDLLGSAVRGHGRVKRVLDGPSCSVLELEDGTLVPFVSDAVASVRDGEIELREGFLE